MHAGFSYRAHDIGTIATRMDQMESLPASYFTRTGRLSFGFSTVPACNRTGRMASRP